jgi:chromate transporter
MMDAVRTRAPAPPADPSPPPDSVGALFVRFLRFGLMAWGGPAAQIAMISKECVDEERWVSQESFKKTLAVYQVLPGPEAHELCVYFGRLRGGRLGGLAAGLGFMLPGFALMLALSVLYVHAGLDERLDELFYGLKAAVGGLVAIAVVRLGRRFITDVPLAVLALVALAATLLASASFVAVLVITGLAYWAWTARPHRDVVAGFAIPLPLVAAVLSTVTLSLTAEIFFEGLKAGLLTFGGAYTAVPFLDQSAVEGKGWLTPSEFLDGLALGGVLPAPMIIFSTFVGYLAGGLAGSLAITVGIFLPAFVFPIFLHGLLVRISESTRIRGFLLGVTAGVVGLIAAVTVDIVGVGVVDVPTAILAVGAFATLYRFHSKATVVFVMLGCGLIGVALQTVAG